MARRMARSRDDAGAKDRTLVITRIFDVPRRAVFKAWTDPQQVTRWMAPRGFTIPSAKADLRPGGGWSMTMRPPKGADLRHHASGYLRERQERDGHKGGWSETFDKLAEHLAKS